MASAADGLRRRSASLAARVFGRFLLPLLVALRGALSVRDLDPPGGRRPPPSSTSPRSADPPPLDRPSSSPLIVVPPCAPSDASAGA
ncbi:MAG: hypothetical protein IPK80_28430 [Nannocystis sp.]|nr:hypothetical protein [Nannocystis sp.]